MYWGLIKEETKEAITISVKTLRVDGSTREILLVGGKDIIGFCIGKAVLVSEDVVKEHLLATEASKKN